MQRKMGVRKKVCSDLQGGENGIALPPSIDPPEGLAERSKASVYITKLNNKLL